MAEAAVQRTRGRNADETRRRLLDAADRVLREHGYAGTSVRTVAAAAEVNPALVFYHYGGVDPLLLAALDRASETRLAEHRETAAQARTLEELTAAAVTIYRTDVERGYLASFSELVAAAVTKPALRAEISTRAEVWVAFVEEHWERVVGGTPLARLLPAREVANAAITFYLGANLFSVIDPDGTRTEDVLGLAGRLAPRASLLTMRLPRRRER
ncbi:TetR family transcriptional regulator [Isoptericola sp. NEAU-Y5]|uniref:TetR family transcriptional regulator n=1 Tax=Isoptericola luteus TaxID=2879484 RepID=A0ABS7ZMH8_9MICO|nr:TetR/AcrR family transcriptional regulator [Isoptericola sp. NEAU-Y5]MCA5894864.1 TetR family transcriptional regulator [Isoptericola sp. NEAU-Y5]MCA5895240.1 TetR family transcriptional regulator [Isoptericola sp. NEAU-Y5]